MALYDWNHDGKKDVSDDFIEYQIYKQSTNSNKEGGGYTPRSGGGISTFGAIVAVIGGLFMAAGIVALFSGGEDAPVILTIILWIVCGGGLGAWFDSVGF